MICNVTISGDSPVIEVHDIYHMHYDTVDYIISYIHIVNDIVDLTSLDKIAILPYSNCRGMYCQTKCGLRWIELYANTKSFSPYYRGYKYKTFGGVKDLTPGGVLAHEFSHHINFLHASLFRTFKRIRKSSKCFTGYGQSKLGEDIAETGRLYISNPKKLKDIDIERFNAFHIIGQKYLR